MTGDMEASCAGHPEPLWDAVVEGEHELEQIERLNRALAICRDCPVRRQCASEVDVRHDDGVRGGLLLPTIHDSDRLSWMNRQPGRGGIAAVLRAAA